GAELPRLRVAILVVLMVFVVWAPPSEQALTLLWAAPVGLAVLALGRDALPRAARGLSALAGAVAALMPAAAMYLSNRERFVFNNFGFHANRVAADFSPAARIPYLHVLFGLPVAVPTNNLSALGPQSMLLFAFALAGVLL